MTTQDNTLKMLGFIYQTYIALIKCLEMNENDKVVIENLGDVTLISSKGISEQIEVKHHLEITTISERSHEIWNTVWNWYNNFDEYSNIEEFILFTTAKLSSRSVFENWDTQDTDQRYDTFKNIGIQVKGEEKVFRPIYNKIFNDGHDINKLKNILNRFKILSKQQTIENIINEYKTTTFKFLGGKDKMENFVSSLIGFLWSIPIKSKIWEISHKEFNDIFTEYSKRFTDNSHIPLPTEFEDLELTSTERESLKNKKFIEEIEKINLIDEITDAMNDYCCTYKTIIAHFTNNIVKSHDLKAYKDDLTKTLSSRRKSYKIKANNDENRLIQSQAMYLDSISMEPRDFRGISDNRVFFQRGVMHIIVDDGNLTWYVGDK